MTSQSQIPLTASSSLSSSSERNSSLILDPTHSPFSAVVNNTATSTSINNNNLIIINDQLSIEYPDLAQLSQEDLTALITDPILFDAYFNTTPQALELHRLYEQRLRSNIAIAEKNESMRPQLEALRAETARLFNEATELKHRASYLDQAQQDLFKRYQPTTQHARLNHATTAQEYLSEQLVNSFLDGQGDDESFARQYREVRKVYHRRALLGNKWSEGNLIWRT